MANPKAVDLAHPKWPSTKRNETLSLTSSRSLRRLRTDERSIVVKWQGNAHRLPGLVNVNKKLWKITILLMGKSTISMAMFNSYVSLPEGIKYYRIVAP
jgi:hypothetical protein